jgi:hypothetical protein
MRRRLGWQKDEQAGYQMAVLRMWIGALAGTLQRTPLSR